MGLLENIHVTICFHRWLTSCLPVYLADKLALIFTAIDQLNFVPSMSLDAEALPTHPDNLKGDNVSNLPTYTNSIGKIYTIVTMVAHFVCILLTSFVAYVSKPGSSKYAL